MLRREHIRGPLPALGSALAAIFSFVESHWRVLSALSVVAAGLLTAVIIADEQGRDDIRYGLPLRVSCEEDIESDLWRGGCERIALTNVVTDRSKFDEITSGPSNPHGRPCRSLAILVKNGGNFFFGCKFTAIGGFDSLMDTSCPALLPGQ